MENFDIKKIIKFHFIGVVISGLLLVITTSTILYISLDYYFSIKQKFESNIGKTYIINNDTTTIIDYSILNNTFILSNGSQVNYKLIVKE